MTQVEFLKSCVGRAYRDFDPNGYYIGCFEPLYLLWPHLPKGKLPSRESAYFAKAYFHFLENFEPVKEPKLLDIVAFCLPGDVFHVGVLLTHSTFLHVQRGGSFEIRRLGTLIKYSLGFFRLREE